MEEGVVTQTRKAADRIALLERLAKAVILSEGVLTFHSLPTLTALNVHQFPSMKGVSTFSLDEDELAGGGAPDAMHVCAIKRRRVHILRVTNEGVTPIRDLPLPEGALVSTFRKQHICVADTENYYVVDLANAVAIPLLPISQAPNVTERPLSITSATSSTPSPTTNGPDPRQRPVVACVGTNEFLIASHTADTTLGVFVTESGEPCRGTLEWSSNLRSLVVDPPYVIALLFNNVIEIHSLHTQEIVQLIQLPVPTTPTPFSFQPRSLVRSWAGLELGSALSGANKAERVSLPLLPSSPMDPPRTPTRSTTSTFSTSPSATTPGKDSKKGLATKTLILGKNSVYALAPLTLVVQADALMDKARYDDALSLAKQIEISDPKAAAEVSYVYLRLAYHSMTETLFQEAFDHFLKSGCDPRLVVRMFPDLRDPLIRQEESVSVCQGVRMEVLDNRSVDEYIMANLNKNYSPHLKPDVATASPTMELRTMLKMTARDSLRAYLGKWRAQRRAGTVKQETVGDSRKVDMVVDTTLVRLYAEEGRSADIVALLDAPNDCVIPAVEPQLLDAGLYDLLASILLKRKELGKTLDIWTKLVEGVYVDEKFSGGVRKVFDLVWGSEDRLMVEKYGLWIMQRDRTLGLKLFSDPKQTIVFDTRDLFGKIKEVDAEAADLFLENAVLQKRGSDSGLHADLIKRYIDRLRNLLMESTINAHLRAQEAEYQSIVASQTSASPPPPTFLSYLASSFNPSSENASFDQVRLKTILFLSNSAHYDTAAMKKELDEMELSGLRGLTLERAIVYGKLRLDRQALSLFLHQLHDLASAEAYCYQCGDPLLPSDVSIAASRLSLLLPKPKKSSSAKREADNSGRKADLARLLVQMCLTTDSSSDEPVMSRIQVARVLDTQGIHLDTLEILPTIPAAYPLSLVEHFAERSIRRSLHSKQEACLLKGLALSQNMQIGDLVTRIHVKMGPTVQRTGPILGSGTKTDRENPSPFARLAEKKDKEGASPEVDEVELDLR
ncbi:hypothetical protein T439DRAFT_70364 [Meredithblackwellia eburnea MCA 4105]